MIKICREIVILLFLSGTISAFGKSIKSSIRVYSPNKELVLNCYIQQNRFYYECRFKDEIIISKSNLGYVFENSDSLVSFAIEKYEIKSINEPWKTVWGQHSKIENKYTELLIQLREYKKSRKLNIRFRLYDNGIGFRYEYPENEDDIKIMDELTEFRFSANHECYWIWADYGTLEKLYYKTPLSEAKHVAAPFTMKTKKGTHVSIFEAALDNYSMMSILQTDSVRYSYKANLAPWHDGILVRTSSPFTSPWRCVLISPDAAGLVESSMVLNFNEAPKLADYSWIKPITYIGIWWEMHLGISEWGIKNGRHGATTENTKKHIDFAAQNGIGGVLIEGWNVGWEDWGQPNAFDFITPYPDFDIFEIVRYAKEKGVEIIGHHETGGDVVAYEAQIDKAFSFYQKLGIRYVKTGYAGPVNPPTERHHGQYMVNHYNFVMRKAMEYQIMLDVHEPVIPSGLSRTYPNLMTFEAVRGMEWNAWSDGNPPSHTCILPFTRALAGPMDYTPGIFNINLDKRAADRKKWNELDNGKSHVQSTLSNQIALMVILYSPLQMASDLIENYKNHPAFEFISNMPSTWDETKVLHAEIGSHLVLARKSGNTWYLAGITNEEERMLPISFDFLPENTKFKLKICQDSKESHYLKNPESYQIKEIEIDKHTKINQFMAAGGGFILTLSK